MAYTASNIEGLEGPFVFHGVQHVFHPPVMLKRWPGKDRRSRIVFIARNLDETALRDTLNVFMAVTKNEGQPVQLSGPADGGQADVALFEDRT